MHRFGRSAQQKIKDRWGGSFILATILAIVGAWFAGQWLNDTLKGGETANTTMPPGVGQQDGKSGGPGVQTAVTPQEFKLYLLQVGAFRSEASAQNLVHGLSEKGFTAMVAPRSVTGFHKVYAGLYTSQAAADEAKSRLISDGTLNQLYLTSLTVSHNPEAVPAVSQGAKAPELRKGLDALNTYLHAAAIWIENQAAGVPGDAATLNDFGSELGKLSTALNKAVATNGELQPFAETAAAAAANATALQNASSTGPSSAEYRTALRDYLAVLEQYRQLHAGSTARN